MRSKVQKWGNSLALRIPKPYAEEADLGPETPVDLSLIAYSFGDRAAQVEFADSPQGARVRVTFDSEPTHTIEQQRDGWQAILDNFTRHVETGG